MKLTRQSYIPQDATPHTCSALGDYAIVYAYSRGPIENPEHYALGFHGKAQKPDFHFKFRSDERLTDHMRRYFESHRQHLARKAEQKAQEAKPHTLTVGAILCSSWGYDQTNIDFYQVTRVIGPHSVEIRKIASSSMGEDGFMTAECVACPDQFTGDPMVKRANHRNSVRIASYASASPWDGKPKRYSWYA